MKKIILIFFFLISLVIGDGDWKKHLGLKKSTSFGLMSEKLGTDFWNFSWTFYNKDNNDIFVSIGPSIFIPTNVGIGWKHYFKTYGDKDSVIPFLCTSIFSRSSNKMSLDSGDAIRDDSCIGFSTGISYFLKKRKKRNIYINAGVFFSYDFRNKPFTLPVINIEFKR